MRRMRPEEEIIFSMSTTTDTIEELVKTEYKYGFVTDVETGAHPV